MLQRTSRERGNLSLNFMCPDQRERALNSGESCGPQRLTLKTPSFTVRTAHASTAVIVNKSVAKPQIKIGTEERNDS